MTPTKFLDEMRGNDVPLADICEDVEDNDVWVDIYLKGGGTHRCKLSESHDWMRANPDKTETRTHKSRRPRLGNWEND